METTQTEEYRKCVKEMRDWLSSQPHLPADVSDVMLYRFAHSNYFDMVKAKKTAELFFTIRGNAPEVLSDRDLRSPHMQKFAKISNFASYGISGNRKLWIWQLNDPGLNNYDCLLDAKFFFLTTDAWLLGEDKQFYDHDVLLMDMKDVSFKMLTRINMSVAKKLSKYQQEAVPIRIKHIHMANTPSVIDKMFIVMKPLLNKEITELMHFHRPNSDTLYQFFNKDELPSDFGGTRDSMATYNSRSLAFLESKRDLLLNENLWVPTKKNKKSSAPAPVLENKPFSAFEID